MSLLSKTILLIGGTGFLGRNIVKSLLVNQYRLIILTRNRQSVEDIFQHENNLDIFEGKLSNLDKITGIINDYKVDIVIHLASNLIPNSNKTDFYKELNDIVLPTFELSHTLAKKEIKLIFFSSAGTIYGNHSDLLSEKTHLNPINNYGFAKLLIEENILFNSRCKRLPYVIIRPSNVYGNLLRKSDQGFIEVAVEKILNEEPIEIWGSGEQKKDYLHVSDICHITNEIISRDIKDEIINLAYGQSFSLIEIISMLEDILGIKPSLIFQKQRKSDVLNVEIDITHLLSIVDFQPLELKKGIKDFCLAYKKLIND